MLQTSIKNNFCFLQSCQLYHESKNNNSKIQLTISTVAGPFERNLKVCFPDPRLPLPFFPLAGPIFAENKNGILDIYNIETKTLHLSCLTKTLDFQK